MITEQQLQSALKSALNEQKEELLKAFTNEIKDVKKELKALSSSVNKIKKVADDALKKAQDNETKLESFTDKLDELSTKYDELEKRNSELSVSASTNAHIIKTLENKLEDSVNRQSRKTIVIKGIKEQKNETWEMTERIVAKKISEASNGDSTEDDAMRMIERAHRSRPNKFKKGRRDIYAALYDWKDTEYLQKTFTAKNIKDRTFKVYCEQKYGTITTARRNEALITRKTLKANGEITSAYVAYPAKLMVKYPGQKRDDKFTLHQDFSNIEIAREKLTAHAAEIGDLSAGE